MYVGVSLVASLESLEQSGGAREMQQDTAVDRRCAVRITAALTTDLGLTLDGTAYLGPPIRGAVPS